jgi:L-lactate dehydrogenase complex protein LldF
MSRKAGFATRCVPHVNNPQLRANLRAAATLFQGGRKQAFADAAWADAARDRARDVKDAALARLPELLEQLEARVEEQGGHVHWAQDAAAARDIIRDIALDAGAASAVKGKSMVSEEIALNPALMDAGLEVYETDLGEFIIQLAGEGPSHIIAPAIHKNRREVGELFAKMLGEPFSEDPAELTKMARRALRRRFLRADLGTSGANMALADSGTMVLLENEGNIRFATTAPRIHVALVGIEKVIASASDAAALLEVLPRSATGQKMPVYTSFLSGPRRAGEHDGAEEFHLVLLDNGRSKLLADPELRPALRCLRCGACLNFCPVYERSGGFAYGGTYCGPIGAAISPLLGQGSGRDLPFACTGCGACAEVCPVRIPLPDILMALRRKAAEEPGFLDPAEHGGPPLSARAAALFARVAGSPGLFRGLFTLARTLDPGLGLSAKLSPGLRAFTRKRKPPRLRPPLAARWAGLRAELERLRRESRHE